MTDGGRWFAHLQYLPQNAPVQDGPEDPLVCSEPRGNVQDGRVRPWNHGPTRAALNPSAMQTRAAPEKVWMELVMSHIGVALYFFLPWGQERGESRRELIRPQWWGFRTTRAIGRRGIGSLQPCVWQCEAWSWGRGWIAQGLKPGLQNLRFKGKRRREVDDSRGKLLKKELRCLMGNFIVSAVGRMLRPLYGILVK